MKAPTVAPDVAMVFSGQGAQWPGMGRDLIRSNKAFLDDIRTMDRILGTLSHPPEWTIEGDHLQ